jgi:hypothetical protein
MTERAFQRELIEVLREMRDIMASLDQDVQDATTVINNLVTALGAASGSGVPAADQTALETAIAAGQAALAPATTDPSAPTTVPAGSSDAQVPTVPETPVAPVVTSPEVA